MEKQPKPCAVCTDCGRPSYSLSAINNPCGRSIGFKKYCKGVKGSALNDNDWAECPTCHGEGSQVGKKCEQCDGAGWIFVRDQPWLTSRRPDPA